MQGCGLSREEETLRSCRSVASAIEVIAPARAAALMAA
jgi:hypothetical protein